MGLGDVSLACATALVDALAAQGVRDACISPGSRSTPLALALARDERVRVHVHLDERSGAFFALGLAKATGASVVLACTSGTATAEYFPAIVEASQARVPLVVLTADRPPRLRDTGANQTIDQRELYGRYARAYVEPPVPESLGDAEAWFDAGLRAAEAATGAPAGPVQMNCPFEEPLVPEGSDDGWARRTPPVSPGRLEDADAARAALAAFRAAYAGRRGAITLGAGRPPASLALLSLGALLGWPVLAEPASGLRIDAGQAGRALSAGQFLIGDPDWLAAHRPEVVLQVGATPTTRATQRLAAETDVLVVLDRDHPNPDPAGRAERRIAVDPELFAALAWDEQDHDLPHDRTGAEWSEAWRTADLVVRRAVDRTLDGWDEPFEGRVARDVGSFIPHGGVLFVGASMPIRDLDAYQAPRRPPRIWNPDDLLRVVANRGASGIDGSVATTLGAATAGIGPTYALMGELTFLVDAGTLLWSAPNGPDAVIVVVSNGGGQIFGELDQASLPEFGELFLTPHPADIGTVCRAAGAGHQTVEHAGELMPALGRGARAGGVQVVEVRVDPEVQRARRAAIRTVVAATLATTP